MMMIPRLLGRWLQVPPGKIGNAGAGVQEKIQFGLILNIESQKHLENLGEAKKPGRWIDQIEV